ncbi:MULTISPECIES: hypothetical protein [Stenotrophomonas]|uniref:hypothetical protein n=1 Tax=Stenotrophomonas TaxID=40323 RepID=UPI000D53F3DA|nr:MULTISPECIES: hypothetical protein [Stenotrophomonas]AWH21851.1 hypothetical protein C1933_11855 [Stenotrophomonas sp. ZAC14D2_NAIMI4_6]
MDVNSADQFGDAGDYDRARKSLYDVSNLLFAFPPQRENERHFLLAAVRRTLSLERAFLQAVDDHNGQMAMTMVRLNLDTVARSYALYWAEETPGMTAESFARRVAEGESIKDFKFRGATEKASDRWLIEQIAPLESWIKDVYRTTSGAIHFSDFHIKQLLQQHDGSSPRTDGAVLVSLVLGPTDFDPSPTRYDEVRAAFLHTTLLLLNLIFHRAKRAGVA